MRVSGRESDSVRKRRTKRERERERERKPMRDKERQF